MYGSLENAVTYFGAGFPEWADLDEEQKTIALTQGSMILDAIYGHRFSGKKTGGYNQLRQWPREGATTTSGEEIPFNIIPAAVEIATFELAKSEVLRPGRILPSSFNSQQIKRQKLDVLEREFFKNQSTVSRDNLPYLPVIEGILFDLLDHTHGQFPIFWVR